MVHQHSLCKITRHVLLVGTSLNVRAKIVIIMSRTKIRTPQMLVSHVKVRETKEGKGKRKLNKKE